MIRLQRMLEEDNPLPRLFQVAHDRLREEEKKHPEAKTAFKIVLAADPSSCEVDKRRFALPSSEEVAIIVDATDKKRDILLQLRPEQRDAKNPLGLQSIHETHRLYLPLAYPLCFPKAEMSWNIKLRLNAEEAPVKRKRGRAGKAAKEKQLLGAPKPTVGKASVPVAVVLAAARASVSDAETRLRDATAAAVTAESALATARSCGVPPEVQERLAKKQANAVASVQTATNRVNRQQRQVAALQGKSVQRAPAELLAEAQLALEAAELLLVEARQEMAKARATCDAVLEGDPAAVSAVASVGLAEDVLRKATARVARKKNAVLGLEVAGSTIPELLNSLNAVLAEVRRLPELIRSRRDALVVPLGLVNMIEAAGALLGAVNTAHDAFSSFQEALTTMFKTMEVMVDYAKQTSELAIKLADEAKVTRADDAEDKAALACAAVAHADAMVVCEDKVSEALRDLTASVAELPSNLREFDCVVLTPSLNGEGHLDIWKFQLLHRRR